MKKIGIMTMHRVVNYGSFLQAYGLKKHVEKLGYHVEFIDYEYEGTLLKKGFTDSFIYKILTHLNVPYHIVKRYYIKKFEKEYRNYLKILDVEKYNYNKNIDSLIIGSDEVFNCIQKYPIGYSRSFFGKGYESKNVFSYAASFGYTTIEGIEKYNISNEIGNLLSKFNSISVRDENSFEIVKKLTGKIPVMHLDPVLISDFTEEINKANIKDISNYIVVYAYTGRLTFEEEKYIKKFAKKYNKKIVSVGFYQKIADINLIVDPFSALKYIQKSDFIITDTFHGTIFSIKLNKKFCTIIRDSNKNKLNYLLKVLKQENQKVLKLQDIEKKYQDPISFNETNKIIKEETRKTIQYLKENLGDKNEK